MFAVVAVGFICILLHNKGEGENETDAEQEREKNGIEADAARKKGGTKRRGGETNTAAHRL